MKLSAETVDAIRAEFRAAGYTRVEFRFFRIWQTYIFAEGSR